MNIIKKNNKLKKYKENKKYNLNFNSLKKMHKIEKNLLAKVLNILKKEENLYMKKYKNNFIKNLRFLK